MEGPVEDEKAVEMGEEGSLRLKEGVEVGDEAAANLFFKMEFQRKSRDIGLKCYLQS